MADATIKSPSAVNSLLSATLRLIKKPAAILSSTRSPLHTIAGGTMRRRLFREPAHVTICFVVIRHDQRLHH